MTMRPTRVLITMGHRYRRTPDGACWDAGHLRYAPFLAEHLEAFGEVAVLTRVAPAGGAEPGWGRADGPGVEIVSAGDWEGLGGFLRRLPRIARACWRALGRCDAVLLRLPGELGVLTGALARLRGVPAGTVLVGRGAEALGLSGRLPRWARAAACGLLERLVRWLVRSAAANAYVADSLHRLYPSARGRRRVFSTVQLSEADFRPPRPASDPPPATFRLVTMANLHWHKGVHVLLEALGRLREAGEAGWRLEVLGDGPQRDELRAQAERMGVGPAVSFAGFIASREELFRRLDEADLFVFPSLTEGMPRAVIEAAARGVPIVATDVGGVADLVGRPWLAPPGDAEALARAIGRAMRDYGAALRDAAEAQRRARRYIEAVQKEQKLAFWGEIQRRAAARQADRARLRD